MGNVTPTLETSLERWRTTSASTAFVPRQVRSVRLVKQAAGACTACELHLRATQTVFGDGPQAAALMLVGEQPGDEEDRQGRPFVGPAGALLEKALHAAGIDRASVYLTNAVKHFNFVLTPGKRRLHEKPKSRHVLACRGWLAAEIESVKPHAIVCLGATAALALMGPTFRLTRSRGTDFDGPRGARILATYHPSAVLRAPDPRKRKEMWNALVSDLGRGHALSGARPSAVAAQPHLDGQ
jgi:DNA polymerase